MCGRYALGIPIEEMPKRFNDAVLSQTSDQLLELELLGENSWETTTEVNGHTERVHIFVAATNYYVSYNIPPTSGGVIIYMDNSTDADFNYVIEPLRFGMLPAWAKPHDSLPVKKLALAGKQYSREVQQHQAKYFNCRKETLAQTQLVWTQPRKTHRCVVPILGYFEWLKTKNDKIPYFVYSKDAPLLFLAGLYSHNTNYNHTELVRDDAKYFSSFAICTGPADGKGSNDMLWLHSRKPVFLKPNTKEWFAWLQDGEWDQKLLDTALNTETNPAYDGVTAHTVAKSVGNPTNKGPEIIQEEKQTQKSIALFFLPKKPKNEASESEQPKQEPELKDPEPAHVEPKEPEPAKVEPKEEQPEEEPEEELEVKEEESGTVRKREEEDSAGEKRRRVQHEGSENYARKEEDDDDEDEDEDEEDEEEEDDDDDDDEDYDDE